jgi:hypothetical protein
MTNIQSLDIEQLANVTGGTGPAPASPRNKGEDNKTVPLSPNVTTPPLAPGVDRFHG